MGNFARSRLPVERVVVVHRGARMRPCIIEVGQEMNLRTNFGEVFKKDAATLKDALEKALPNGTLIELKRLFGEEK